MGNGARLCCKAADCGSEIRLYLRAKLGSCNCTTGIAEDTDLDRMSDFDLVGGEVSPLGAGRPIAVAFRQNGRRWRDVEHTRSQDDLRKSDRAGDARRARIDELDDEITELEQRASDLVRAFASRGGGQGYGTAARGHPRRVVANKARRAA
jgi:hypothetical protein